jgi:signal transduction histidine kinase
MGLGLPISYMIVKDHGGDIKVFSEIGKGAKFVISLPLAQPKI